MHHRPAGRETNDDGALAVVLRRRDRTSLCQASGHDRRGREFTDPVQCHNVHHQHHQQDLVGKLTPGSTPFAQCIGLPIRALHRDDTIVRISTTGLYGDAQPCIPGERYM